MELFNENTKKGTSIELSGGYEVRAERDEKGTRVTLMLPDGKSVVMGDEHARLVADAIPKVINAAR